ncbi:hypothetical protein AX774_g5952, partial [Zancudomyces culisetae]
KSESKRDSETSSSLSTASSMDQETGVLSPRTLGELTESVRQLQIRRSPEPMSVSSISPTLYRGNSSPEHPYMHITLRGSGASSSSGHTRTGMTRDEHNNHDLPNYDYYDMASATGSFFNNDHRDEDQARSSPAISDSPKLYFSPRSSNSTDSTPKSSTAQVAKRLFTNGVNKLKEFAPKSIEIFNFDTSSGKQNENKEAGTSKTKIRTQVIGSKTAKEVLESNVKATQERMKMGQKELAPGWLPVPPSVFSNSWDQDPEEFLNYFCKHVNALEHVMTLEETFIYLENFLEGSIKKTLVDLMFNNSNNNSPYKSSEKPRTENRSKYETPTKNNRYNKMERNNIRCYKCRQYGHYASDCTASIEDVEMKTASPIKRTPDNPRHEVNLVEIKEQGIKHPVVSQREMSNKITAIMGSVKVNNISTRFQYDSGAATNLMSSEMARRLNLGKGQETTVTIVGVEGHHSKPRQDGNTEPTKTILAVNLIDNQGMIINQQLEEHQKQQLKAVIRDMRMSLLMI